MLIRDSSNCPEFIGGDNTHLRELLNPLKEPELSLRYSLAVAEVEPGETTFLHRLKTSEVYYIVEGTGEMEVGGRKSVVTAGQAIYVPPGETQRITNNGIGELIFLCIVDPAWRPEDEEVLEEK